MHLNHVIGKIRYSTRRICDPQTWRIPPRVIPDHEFVLIDQGKGTVIIENKPYALRAGMMLYFHPGLIHSMETDSKDPLSFYAFHFSYAEVDYSNGQWFLTEGVSPLPLQVVQNISNSGLCLETMKRINDTWNHKLPGYELVCTSAFSQLIYFIMQNSFRQHGNHFHGRKVEAAIQYIKSHTGSPICLDDLANMTGMSVDYLSRCFKHCTGLSLKKYINMVKIDTAKHMLMEGSKRIKEVAQAVGFSDEYYFSRLFKALTGVSPSGYLKSMR